MIISCLLLQQHSVALFKESVAAAEAAVQAFSGGQRMTGDAEVLRCDLPRAIKQVIGRAGSRNWFS